MRVTTDGAGMRPEWSADGERLAYVKLGDSLVVWRSINSTAAPTPVVRSSLTISTFDIGETHGHVALSASNNAVSVLNDIFVSSVDSLAAPTPFQAEPYIESTPRISADERMIAYVSNRTGRSEVYVRAFLTDGPEVPVSGGDGSEPIWSRDGRELFYRVPGYLMSARFSAGRPQPTIESRDTLFADVFLTASSSVNYDVFPDGRSFAMLRRLSGASSNDASSIVVITNWQGGMN
jgi:serine/threonine-protein kinase